MMLAVTEAQWRGAFSAAIRPLDLNWRRDTSGRSTEFIGDVYDTPLLMEPPYTFACWQRDSATFGYIIRRYWGNSRLLFVKRSPRLMDSNERSKRPDWWTSESRAGKAGAS